MQKALFVSYETIFRKVVFIIENDWFSFPVTDDMRQHKTSYGLLEGLFFRRTLYSYSILIAIMMQINARYVFLHWDGLILSIR